MRRSSCRARVAAASFLSPARIRTLGSNLKIVELDDSSRVVSTRLSCGDKSNLDEVITVSDEWYVSRGLLVSPAAAALAVREFWLTGSAGPSVEWIRPADIGPNGNW